MLVPLRLLTICLVVIFASIAHAASTPPPSTKLKIVASFSILGDMVRQVGGGLVDVQVIVPENADPHVYQPTPQDAKMIARADLVIRNGLGFEGWLDRLIDNSGYKGPNVIAAQKVTPRPLPQTGHTTSKTIVDPHAWHCVQNAILYVDVITQALKVALPDHQLILDEHKRKYIDELKNLDSWIRAEYRKLPSERRYVITTHDAFWYYGDAYNVQFLSPIGISTDAEPTAAAVAQLIRDIREKQIRAIFIENLSSRKLIEEIAKEAKISIDGILYADSLSDSQASNLPAQTYVDLMRHNTLQIIKGLRN